MTGVTRLSRHNVRRALAYGNDPIVATLTGSDHFIMIHCGYWYPAYGGMTGIATIR